MSRYFMEIAYQGAAYRGWQVQPQQVTVQSTINDALGTLFKREMMVTGCGRTDAGVHASQFFLHFDAEEDLPERLNFKLNCMLPRDIVIHRIFEVADNAHTRFDATYRAYDYYIHFYKDPFLEGLSFNYFWSDLDFEAIRKAFYLLNNYQDFHMFCKRGGDHKTTLCNIFKTQFNAESNRKIQFHIAANRFLRGMIRRIVGTMLLVGRGKITLDEFEEVMDTNSTFRINLAAPPVGLYLSEVRYDNNDYDQAKPIV